jgi:hypothetical protein
VLRKHGNDQGYCLNGHGVIDLNNITLKELTIKQTLSAKAPLRGL